MEIEIRHILALLGAIYLVAVLEAQYGVRDYVHATRKLAFAPNLTDASADAWTASVPWSLCSEESGTLTHRHAAFLNRFNGRRLVLVGDSLFRYQYQELAHYLVHGYCPAPEDKYGYTVNKNTYSTHGEFVRNASDALTIEGYMGRSHFRARDFSFAGQIQTRPTLEGENRLFTYEDGTGRTIELVYIMYRTEQYGTLRLAFDMAHNFRPTDVVVSFAEWFKGVDPETTCGDERTTWPHGAPGCPHMPDVCEFLKGDHTYNVWWSTSTPKLSNKINGMFRDIIGPGHKLDPVSQCKLPGNMVLNRTDMIFKAEPDVSKQHRLFLADDQTDRPYRQRDKLHLQSEAYHAFNWQLAETLTPSTDAAPT